MLPVPILAVPPDGEVGQVEGAVWGEQGRLILEGDLAIEQEVRDDHLAL